MTARTVDCIECGESVAYGRLSCPACGALLASMAGASRQAFEPSTGVARAGVGLPPGPAANPDRPTPAPSADLVPPNPAGPEPEPEPYLVPDDEPTVGRTVAGAYRPPAPALPMAAAMTAPAAAPQWAAGARPVASPATGASEPGTTGSTRPKAGLLDAARSTELAGWFVIVGAALSAFGFLLPWSRVVIGARSVGGYLDTWGLASPTHVVVLLAILATLGLGIATTRVPAWLRSGVLGLALGSLLVGLTWPYIVGPLGADIGVTVVTIGGLTLVTGGVVASWATHHAEAQPSV